MLDFDLHGLKTVSYTHLDVYKRQIRGYRRSFSAVFHTESLCESTQLCP